MKTEAEAWKMLERALLDHPLLVLFAARRMIARYGVSGATRNINAMCTLARLNDPLRLAGAVISATPEQLRRAAVFLRTPPLSGYDARRRAAARAEDVAEESGRSLHMRAAADRRWRLAVARKQPHPPKA